MDVPLIGMVGYGMLLGLIGSALGYFGNGVGAKENKFDFKAMVPKILLGGGLGVIAYYNDIKVDSFLEWVGGTGIVLVSSKALKGAWVNVLETGVAGFFRKVLGTDTKK